MKQLVLGAALVCTGIIIGAVSSDDTNGTANAQFAPPSGQSGDALMAPTKVRRKRVVPTCQQRTCTCV